jgi:hypothetical protein
MADAAAEGQATDTGAAVDAARHGHAERMRGVIHVRQSAAASDRTVRAAASTRMPFDPDRSMTSPSSQVPSPPPLCPPPRTASSSDRSRA